MKILRKPLHGIKNIDRNISLIPVSMKTIFITGE